jgi:hypothetical protein
MAQAQSCATKTLFRIGTVRGNMAFLRQPEQRQLSTILSRFALQYRITPNAMTRARLLQDAIPDDCAATLVNNLNRITADAGFIKGINRVDAEVVNSHLQALADDCKTFALAQDLNTRAHADISTAVQRFLDRGFDGAFAGSAIPASAYG